MTVRAETIRERLAFVRRNLAQLSQSGAAPTEAFMQNLRDQWAAAYGLQVTVQSLLDAGAHILAGAHAEAPRDYGEIVPLLVRHAVLDPALGHRLAGLSGFRNILVHEYAEVDFKLVHDKLGRLDDLRAFAAAIERWLIAQGL